MLSPYRVESNKRTKKASNTNINYNSNREFDVKGPQMTSNDLKTTQPITKSNQKNKNLLKAGSVHESIEINEHYLDEILHKVIYELLYV